jgi:hypothetical protein
MVHNYQSHRLLFYQLAKRGVVLPLFKQYGSFMKTHRIFRHYLYTLILPLPLLLIYNTSNYVNHVEYLWSVHQNRLKYKYGIELIQHHNHTAAYILAKGVATNSA